MTPVASAPSASELTRLQLGAVRDYYDRAPTSLNRWAAHYRDLLARYYNRLIPTGATVLEIGCGAGGLLARIRARRKVGIDLSEPQLAAARCRLPDAEFHCQAAEELALDERFDCIVISETLNSAADVQVLLDRLHTVSHAGTRLIVNFPSAVWRPAWWLARVLGLKRQEPNGNWLAPSDVLSLFELTDWGRVTLQPRLLLPVRCPGIEPALNRWLAPLLPWMCVTVFAVARPRRFRETGPLSVSVVIPARNEAGNIRAAVQRTPEMGAGTEIILVEGHSRDSTWEEMQKVAREHPHRRIKLLRQAGVGKGDAVRAGFAAAQGDLFMILDADLTVPPEDLPKFYEAIASGRAEFINGSRLVYPMETEAMQFLNLCANKVFGLLFTWILGQPIKDTLCGTKVLRGRDYRRILANRAEFSDLDPFGDFDLLFGAVRLNLKIIDLPVRYRERTYGTTNIQRWRHGMLLLRMTAFAARKLKFV